MLHQRINIIICSVDSFQITESLNLLSILLYKTTHFFSIRIYQLFLKNIIEITRLESCSNNRITILIIQLNYINISLLNIG